MSELYLSGLSTTPRDLSGCSDIKDQLEQRNLNCIRLAYNPIKQSGSRPLDKAHIQYFLDEWDGYIVVDRNHRIGIYNMTVQDMMEGCLDVCNEPNFKNNHRIFCEVVNEDKRPELNQYVQEVINNLRWQGITNEIVQNRHNGQQTWAKYSEPVHQGMHHYFDAYSPGGAAWNYRGNNQAFSKGIEKFLCTEIGAHRLEKGSFTSSLVDEVKQWYDFSLNNGVKPIGNCLWCHRDVDNLIGSNGYDSYDLVIPEGVSPSMPDEPPEIDLGNYYTRGDIDIIVDTLEVEINKNKADIVSINQTLTEIGVALTDINDVINKVKAAMCP